MSYLEHTPIHYIKGFFLGGGDQEQGNSWLICYLWIENCATNSEALLVISKCYFFSATLFQNEDEYSDVFYITMNRIKNKMKSLHENKGQMRLST